MSGFATVIVSSLILNCRYHQLTQIHFLSCTNVSTYSHSKALNVEYKITQTTGNSAYFPPKRCHLPLPILQVTQTEISWSVDGSDRLGRSSYRQEFKCPGIENGDINLPSLILMSLLPGG